MPSGMGPLAIVLLVHGATGSYGHAGLVAGAFAVGQAVGGPLQGRLIDRAGQTAVLSVGGALFAGSFLALAATRGHTAPLVECGWAGLAGVAYPPLGPVVQAVWAATFVGARLQMAYAFQATVQEAIFIGGPLLVSGLVTWSSAAVAVAAAAGLSLVGTIGFVTSPRSLRWTARRPAADWAGPLRAGGVRTLVALHGLVAVAFAFMQVAAAAYAADQGDPGRSGVLLALWTSGSLVGGLLNGSRVWRSPPERRLRWLLAVLAVAFAPPALTPGVYGLAGLMFVAGLPIAPALGCAYALVERLAPPGTLTEAFTWIGSGFLLGLSLGSSAAGVTADHYGPSTTFVAGSVALAIGAATAAVRADSLAGDPHPACE
jgi:MFS family permease